ncbi:NAD(P)-dependent oxidoreductase [Leuconostocaceae bacterium ESL0723]|nr:NAD(P)-dependent oxidoreductase [Leuconostocaceae bacterium ESL0723]
MNILVSAPNQNFDLETMKTILNKHFEGSDDRLYYADQKLRQGELNNIDVFLGYHPVYLDQILADPESRLGFLQALSVGTDYLPLDALATRGIELANVQGVQREPIAETIIGVILVRYRQLNAFQNLDRWGPVDGPFKLIAGKKVVVFGTGGIGQRTAELLQAFHAHTIGVNSNGHAAQNFDETVALSDLSESVFNADIIINALPLNDHTQDIFDQHFFDQLRQKPIFINVGRGGSVVTDDLVAALKNGQLDSAALDVVDPEPLPNDHPLYGMDNVLLSPHTSAAYDDYLQDSFSIFYDNLACYKKDGSIEINQIHLD